MTDTQEPMAPFTFRETEPYVGEGPMLRTRRRRWITVSVAVLVLVVAALAAVVPRLLWSQQLDPSRNAQTGLPDGRYVITPTASMHEGDDCWFRGPVRGVPESGEVTVVGSGPVQCAAATERVAEVNITVKGGTATITVADTY